MKSCKSCFHYAVNTSHGFKGICIAFGRRVYKGQKARRFYWREK